MDFWLLAPAGAALIFVFIAYFVKGFSGFGPSLILVPALTILYDPQSAVSTAALFDFAAGILLLLPVFKQIRWKFVALVSLAVFPGAFLGALLLKHAPAQAIERIMAIVLIVFILILVIQNPESLRLPKRWARYFLLPVSFLAGFTGGLIGITGPLLVILMKLRYDKTFFRNQLIAIFLLGAGWRFLLYQSHAIHIKIPVVLIVVMFVILLFGLWVGQHYHRRVNEKRFNRIVALILIIPALNLLLF